MFSEAISFPRSLALTHNGPPNISHSTNGFAYETAISRLLRLSSDNQKCSYTASPLVNDSAFLPSELLHLKNHHISDIVDKNDIKLVALSTNVSWGVEGIIDIHREDDRVSNTR